MAYLTRTMDSPPLPSIEPTEQLLPKDVLKFAAKVEKENISKEVLGAMKNKTKQLTLPALADTYLISFTNSPRWGINLGAVIRNDWTDG